MVWDDRLISVKEVTEIKRITPRFPSRERNFAVRRRGPRRLNTPQLGASLVCGFDERGVNQALFAVSRPESIAEDDEEEPVTSTTDDNDAE